MEAKFSDLLGKTLISIIVNNNDSDHIKIYGDDIEPYSRNNCDDEIIFKTNKDELFMLTHIQDYSESVEIEDIEGNLDDLINTPILQAEEVSKISEENEESSTWTFYKLATIKGYVTIRWVGSSNGYYSELVNFLKADKNGKF